MTQVFQDLADLRSFATRVKAQGQKISFVPTMGALHDGHLALVSDAINKADVAIVSIFVNPKQFAPHEDYNAYPRTWDEDLEKLKTAGVHAIWHPPLPVMYPDGFETSVKVAHVSQPLEGEFRPHFFEGVATVVSKLLLQVMPDIAIFGEKDYQQLQVIKALQRDLNLPVEIIGAATVRDKDGLALSSRNAYLSDQELKIAKTINKTLFAMRDKILSGEDIQAVEAWGQSALMAQGFQKIDYCTVRHAQTLQPAHPNDVKRILFAGWLGRARLIDNIAA